MNLTACLPKSLLFCIAFSFALSQPASQKPDWSHGGIVRTDKTQKQINLVFTGHEFAEGGETILSALKKHGISASFFFTGDFYRNKEFSPLISSLKTAGHYLGAHSDKHLLYASWDKRDSLLVTRRQFTDDILANYREMDRFGIGKQSAPFFLPPFEWYNDSISHWCEEMEIRLVNFTPGTYSNADWTYPELGNQYLSSDTIFSRILSFEKGQPDGLNGFVLLMHIGTDPRRKDKFYFKLDQLLQELKRRGYRFTLLRESIR